MISHNDPLGTLADGRREGEREDKVLFLQRQ